MSMYVKSKISVGFKQTLIITMVIKSKWYNLQGVTQHAAIMYIWIL